MKIIFKNFAFFFFLVLALPIVALAKSDDQQIEKFSQTDLEELLSPIALYPDPLLAQLLPASTYPLEVVEAGRLIHDEKDFSKIDSQDWDPSVQAIAHYPAVLKLMNDDLEWTQQLGVAFLNQQDDVMKTVQALRQQAETAGNLKTTKQHVVQVTKKYIEILPANPEIIYVPVYNPTVVYVTPIVPVYYPLVSFGFGYHIGSWLNIGFYWPTHTVFYCGSHYWYPGWYGGYGHHTTVYNIYATNVYRNNSVTRNVWKHNGKHGSPLRGASQFSRKTASRDSSAQTHTRGTQLSSHSRTQAQNLENFKHGLSRTKTASNSHQATQTTTTRRASSSHVSSTTRTQSPPTTQRRSSSHVTSPSETQTQPISRENTVSSNSGTTRPSSARNNSATSHSTSTRSNTQSRSSARH